MEANAKPDPNAPMEAKEKRKFFMVVGFMIFLSLLIMAGGVFAWIDEHSGIGGTAHVTRCVSHYAGGPGAGHSSLDCDGTWVYKGRVVSGYVENGKRNQVGKDVSVRIHGTSHVTVQTYWVPLGLFIGGLLCGGLFVWLTVKVARRPTAPPATDPAAA